MPSNCAAVTVKSQVLPVGYASLSARVRTPCPVHLAHPSDARNWSLMTPIPRDAIWADMPRYESAAASAVSALPWAETASLRAMSAALAAFSAPTSAVTSSILMLATSISTAGVTVATARTPARNETTSAAAAGSAISSVMVSHWPAAAGANAAPPETPAEVKSARRLASVSNSRFVGSPLKRTLTETRMMRPGTYSAVPRETMTRVALMPAAIRMKSPATGSNSNE